MKKQKDPTFLEGCLKVWQELSPGGKMVVGSGVFVFLLWLSAHPDILQAMVVAMKLWTAMHGAASCGC